MNINIISLKRSISRRESFCKLNQHIEYEFFDAIDGTKLTKELICDKRLFQPGLNYTPGAFGCALSHLALWEKAINLKKTITIAEDDSIFRFDFEEKYLKKINELPRDWDIILWGWNFDSILSLDVMPNISPAVMVFNQDQLRDCVNNFQLLSGDTSLMKLDKCFGTPAYSISASGAAKFKSLCFPLADFKLFFPLLNRELPNNGIDIAMNRIYQATNSYVSFPPLAITKNERTTSTIQTNT